MVFILAGNIHRNPIPAISGCSLAAFVDVLVPGKKNPAGLAGFSYSRLIKEQEQQRRDKSLVRVQNASSCLYIPT
jgi:hypothetical protein